MGMEGVVFGREVIRKREQVFVGDIVYIVVFYIQYSGRIVGIKYLLVFGFIQFEVIGWGWIYFRNGVGEEVVEFFVSIVFYFILFSRVKILLDSFQVDGYLLAQ